MANDGKATRWSRRPGALVLALAILTVGCGGDDPAGSASSRSAASAPTGNAEQTAPPQHPVVAPRYTETGDLNALRERGKLRLLAPRWEGGGLPRSGLPAAEMREMGEAFARRMGLEPEWILIPRFDDLIAALNAGDGDLIATNLTQTESRETEIAFSLPVDQVREWVLVRRDAPPVNRVEDLGLLRLVVPEGSAYAESLATVATASTVLGDSAAGPDGMLDLVVSGEADATVMDSNQARGLAGYRDDFRRAWTLPGTRNLAWGVRKDNPNLLLALNLFLSEVKLAGREETYAEDLSALKTRGQLRVIMRNGPATYFLWKGELRGFEYELAKWFAGSEKLRLEVIVPPDEVDPLDYLAQGHGDLVASALTVTPGREARGFRFSRRYHSVSEVFVTGADAPAVETLADLAGRQVVVHRDSSYWESLQAVRDELGFELIAAPDGHDTQDILEDVMVGTIDVTLADSHIVDIETTFSDEIVRGIALGDPVEHGWVVRQGDTELLGSVDAFFKRHYRGLKFNTIYNRYFRDKRRMRAHEDHRDADTLSPFDGLVRTQADAFTFDWRLIVAQMYQESRFDPQANSFAGARGLLQVLPRTAKELGYRDADGLYDPATGIEVGVRYLDWTRDRFAVTLPVDERLWFSLAAYNAGFGHVYDARRLARQQGLDPNQWFDNVERAMLLLSKRQYARKAKYGYVRGREPVNYVQNIRNRYRGYVEHTPSF